VAFPDVAAANAALEQHGFKISRGWFGTFGSKIKVLAPDGKEEVFDYDGDFLDWVRSFYGTGRGLI
jgi:hypothetical protein